MDDIDDIPTFLDRTRNRTAKDQAEIDAAKAERDAEQKRKADLAKERRKVKEEIRDAELTGKRRKLPLTGKAALEHIRGG